MSKKRFELLTDAQWELILMRTMLLDVSSDLGLDYVEFAVDFG